MLNVSVAGAEPPEGEEEMKYVTRSVKYLKEVVVAKDPPVVHVFDVVEHGRRFYRTLTFSSDASLSLVSKAPAGVSADSFPILPGFFLILRCPAREISRFWSNPVCLFSNEMLALDDRKNIERTSAPSRRTIKNRTSSVGW